MLGRKHLNNIHTYIHTYIHRHFSIYYIYITMMMSHCTEYWWYIQLIHLYLPPWRYIQFKHLYIPPTKCMLIVILFQYIKNANDLFRLLPEHQSRMMAMKILKKGVIYTFDNFLRILPTLICLCRPDYKGGLLLGTRLLRSDLRS